MHRMKKWFAGQHLPLFVSTGAFAAPQGYIYWKDPLYYGTLGKLKSNAVQYLCRHGIEIHCPVLVVYSLVHFALERKHTVRSVYMIFRVFAVWQERRRLLLPLRRQNLPMLVSCQVGEECCLVSLPHAGCVFRVSHHATYVRDDPWHQTHPLNICALTSARAFAAATWCARPRARSSRSLNFLTAREPTSLSSRRQLLLLASHRMALTRERNLKNLSRFAWEIKIFSIFARLVPTSVPKHNSRFWVFLSTICWTWWSINIYEIFKFCWKKIAVSMWNLVSAPCSETGPNLRTWLFVDCWLLITKLWTEINISILKQNKLTLWVLGEEILGKGILTIGKWEFTILQNGMVSYTC